MSNDSSNSLKVSSEPGLIIKKELLKYLRFWPWFLLSVIIALLGAYLYLRYTPKIFNSAAKIKILNKKKGIELPSSAFIFNRSNINLENEIEIMKSYRIVEQVVEQLDLSTNFYDEGNVRTTELAELPFVFEKKDSLSYGLFRIIVNADGFTIERESDGEVFVSPEFNTFENDLDIPFNIKLADKDSYKNFEGKTYLVRFSSKRGVTKGLKGALSVTVLGKDSDLLKISLNGQSKRKSERIINTLISVFNYDGIYDRQQVSKRTIDFINDRFVSLVEELDSIETNIKDFKQNNNFINLETDAQLGLNERTIARQELFNLENQLALAEAFKETLASAVGKYELLPANFGIESLDVNSLVFEYNDLITQRNNLLKDAGGNNPSVININSRIAGVENNILSTTTNYLLQLKSTKSQIEIKNSKYSAQVASLPNKEKLLRSIKRQQEIKQSLYLFLLQKREEAAINLAITEPSIKVVEYAISGGGPVAPNSRSTYIMALALGLLLPLGVIYLLLLLNTKLQSKLDVEELTDNGLILAEIPELKGNVNDFLEDPNDRSILAESFRILSSNVNYMIPSTNDNNGKVIYCTSTIKGEGKTYISVNLSLALSSINRKVLLIGADLRNPQIHSHINIDKQQAGLTNYLHDEAVSWQDVRVKGFEKHRDHDTIISGPIPPNPAQLLTNGRFRKLIEEAREHYDYIIVDTSPTILVTDTMLISQLADATIYITRANFTEKNLMNFSNELRESGRLKNVAYVLNGVGASKSYNYSYNYGYGYGYGSKS